MTAQISALPTPPSTNDPANFNTRADAFLSALSTFATEANAVVGEVDANAQSAASAASLAGEKAAEAGARASDAAASAASALNAPGVNGSSSTSLTVATGSKSFTAQTGKAWLAGQGFFLASSASPLNWMTGVLTAYNPTTGAATVQVDTIGGSGSFSAWNCGLAAGRPLPMASQSAAEAGTDNGSWMTPLATSQAIAMQAFPVGSLIESAAPLGSRWLPCTGLNYLNSAYPTLAALMPVYINPMTLRMSGNVSRMCFGGGVFVAWVYNGAVYNLHTSSDGVSWTQRTNPFGSNASSVPAAIAYGNGMFLAGKPGTLYSSSDGVVWTVRSLPIGSSDFLYSIAYGGGQWMVQGGISGGYSRVHTTSDFVNWSTRTPPWNNSTIITYSPSLNRWLAGYAYGAGAFSDDGGATWTVFGIASSSDGVITSMAWGGDRFVAVTSAGRIWYSTTGTTTFTEALSGSAIFAGSYCSQVFYDGARFIVGGLGAPKLAQSTDASATSWISPGPSPSSDTCCVAKANSALTTPIVIGASASPGTGIYSGLDRSTTQFVVPLLTARSPLLPPYIKAS